MENELEIQIERKSKALAKHLGVGVDEVWDDAIVDNLFHCANQEYTVLNDKEADEALHDCIRKSLWAFRPEFLAGYCPRCISVEIIKLIQIKGEDCNDALVDLVDDTSRFKDLVRDAAASDTRGHFLSDYDSREYEETIDGEDFYIYRQN